MVIMQENMHSSNSTQNNVLCKRKKVIKSKQLDKVDQFEWFQLKYNFIIMTQSTILTMIFLKLCIENHLSQYIYIFQKPQTLI